MTITPNEISNKDFKKVLRGYDVDEVDEFLEQIVEDYELVYKESISQKEKISNLLEKLEQYTNIESTLQNTLVLAQSAADQAKENSKKESEILLKDAQEAANETIRKSEAKVNEINKEYESIKQQFNMFKSSFKAMLEAQIDAIDNSASNTQLD